jgi:hypothetical protein
VASLIRRLRGDLESRYSLEDWWADKQAEVFSFSGKSYSTFGFGLGSSPGVETADGFSGYMAAVRQSPPAFGAQLVRGLVLSQARFAFRNRVDRRLFGTAALARLEAPWPKGSTAELVTKMEWHAGAAGNAFVFDDGRRLRLLDPSKVTIVIGSPDGPRDQIDPLVDDVIGYGFWRDGIGQGKAITLMPEEVAHWAPLPDPLALEKGMSWLTPVLREISGDVAATRHKIKYFENGATPNLVVKGIPAASPEAFKAWVETLEEGHTGVHNAYRTLYLTAGADAGVLGANLKDLDYKALQGSAETRISVASRVPAALLGISEGLAGSALNAGNYGAARRNFADSWLYPTLQSLCACLSQIIPVPGDAELWFDTSDMPFVREDEKDAAEIRSMDATVLRTLVDAGYDPDAAVAFLQGRGDLSQLVGKHSGMFSVQLQEPGAATSGTPAP